MNKGWRGEPRRHSLAAHGISSSRRTMVACGGGVGGAVGSLWRRFVLEGAVVSPAPHGLKAEFEDGNCLALDLSEFDGGIAVNTLWVEQKGTGLGSRAVEMLKDYVGENDLELYARDVDNPEFWEKHNFQLFDDENWVYRWMG